MRSTWSFYTLADGLFTGQTFSGPQEMLSANTPSGCGYMEGSYDYLSKRVISGVVVEWQPTKPDDTDEQTYAWNTTVKRWIATPTLEGKRVPLRAVVQAAFERLERAQNRPLREMQINAEGTQEYTDAQAVLEIIEAKAEQLRGKLSDINNAASEGALPTAQAITAIA